MGDRIHHHSGQAWYANLPLGHIRDLVQEKMRGARYGAQSLGVVVESRTW